MFKAIMVLEHTDGRRSIIKEEGEKALTLSLRHFDAYDMERFFEVTYRNTPLTHSLMDEIEGSNIISRESLYLHDVSQILYLIKA